MNSLIYFENYIIKFFKKNSKTCGKNTMDVHNISILLFFYFSLLKTKINASNEDIL